jgi:hypothetical protein
MGRSIIISSQDPDFREEKVSELKAELGIEAADFTDFFEIVPAEGRRSLGIEQMKILKDWTRLKPFRSKNRLVIISEAEVLTVEAQNSILKLLEEPFEFLTLTLVTSDYRKLLDTITSRCILIEDLSAALPEIKMTAVSLPLTERFAAVEELLRIKDKQQQRREVQNFLHNLAVENRHGLLYDGSRSKFQKRLELIQQAKTMLDRSVLLRLVLENLVISLEEQND